MMTILQFLPELAIAAAGVLAGYLARPRVKAEAAKAVAEGTALDWHRFHAEIARQDAKIAAMEARLLRQDAEIDNLKHDREARDGELIVERKENRALIAKLGRLESRLSKIEALLKLHPITPELQADLDKLNND